MRGRWIRAAVGLVAAAVLCAALAATAGARVDARGAAAAKVVKVGFIYSRTGLLSQFGAEEIQGFKLGLEYTKGQCGGYTIEPTYVDDATDPAKAVAAAKDLIGQGYKIIAGTASSGAALQIAPIADQNQILYISGAAASDAITGLNKHTFRAGRQSYQDVLDAAGILPPKSTGKKITVFAEDTAFGPGNFAAVSAVFGSKGHTVSKILVAVRRRGSHPVRPAAEEREGGRGVRRVGGSERPADVAGAAAAGRATVHDDRDGPREPRHLSGLRTASAGRDARLALRLPGAEERGQRLARQAHEAQRPGAGHLHAGRLRRGADDVPRDREGRRRLERRRDDLGARGLAIHGTEGQAAHPPARITPCSSRCSRFSSSRTRKASTT